MAVLQRATGKPASSIFIFNFTVADFTMANELELMAAYIIWEMVVISVSWVEFQKSDGAWWTGHPLTKHICGAQSVHKRGTHTTRLAQVTRIAVSALCAWKESSHLVSHMSHPLLLSPTCRSLRAHHLPHSLFLLPRHKNTQHNRCNTVTSKNTQFIMRISKLSQSTSSAIKNRSGVKTCRVAETRARQLPQKQKLLGPMTWKVTRRNVWQDIANLQRKRLNNETKSQHHAWMTIGLKKKEWVSRRIFYSLLKNCSEMPVFSPYWETWHFVVCEQAGACFHKMDRHLVTNAWRVWSLTFIIQVNIGTVVMLETQHNNADLDCFKTLILQETLKTQNQPQEEFCAFSEGTRLCQQVGCARNRLHFHTVLQKLKSFLSMQVYA